MTTAGRGVSGHPFYMARNARTNWSLPEVGQPGHGIHQATLATLMDVRDTLDSIDASLKALRCVNFLRIPAKLDAIRLNTTKRKYTKKPKSNG